MVSWADLSEQERVDALDSVYEGKGLSGDLPGCSKCEDVLEVGWHPFGTQGTTDTIKWMFFCGHGYEVVMNFNRDTIKRLVESLL